jgi:peptidoglycan/xylan/chitin deacetylase (PgdA/CDA1 family)
MNKICLLTNDVETTSIWFNDLRDETGVKVLNEGLPRLLDIYAKYEIQCTFFFTGYIAKLLPQAVKRVMSYGHEIGSHGLSHKKEDGFDILPFNKQKQHLLESKKILEDISREEVLSFRSPALRVNQHTARALVETGFKIDSSVASQRFDMFLSFGGIQKLKWLYAPRKPYRTSLQNIFQKGDGPILEIPLSALFFPYVGTFMRIFPLMTRILRYLLSEETKLTEKPIVFDIHPNEFIDESPEARKISKRSENLLKFLFQDLVRSRLKIRNLGGHALTLYESQIQFFLNKGFKFMPLKEYSQLFFDSRGFEG